MEAKLHYTKLRIKYYYIRLDLCSLRSMAAFHTKVILMSYTQFSIRHACGLFDYVNRTNLVPPARVFTGFLKRLGEFQDEVDCIFQKQVDFLYANIEGFGETLAGDGKIINSYSKNKPKEAVANPDSRSEVDAEYTTKTYNYTTEDGKKHEKKSTYYGFNTKLRIKYYYNYYLNTLDII